MSIAAGMRGTNRVQRLGVIAAIAVGAMAFTGCSAINPQSTTMVVSVSDGVRTDLGKLELRNILIVSNGKGEPGRIIGAVYNTSDADITLTFSGDQGAQTQITVKPGVPYLLDGTSDSAILGSVTQMPGAVEKLTLTQTGPGEQSRTFDVPILNGTLHEYSTLVPTAPATPTESATPLAKESATASATPTP
ncbi:hypothetical protein [Specibacter cremeus]|uniref:hypothetical protein n=1 Tax=Specibacter cremeus TaxID=1629051 RepID=UPI001F0BAB0D|nr:hypothetical protein [Specibacter cremeus]